MASDLNSEIKIGADASGVEAGVSRAKRSLKDLSDAARVAGDGVAAAGEKATKGLAGMGDGGEAAARKLQRDTASMQGSLQRYLSTLEAGSKDSRKYWETMADFKGIDKNALNPLLDKLDSFKAKTETAKESTNSLALSLGGIGAAAAGIAAVTASVGVAAKAMFEASASAERLRTMLDFSTGGNSAKEIEYLRSVTYRLGLEFSSTAKAYGQFQAAAKGTALEGDKARAVFESVAKASAVMGLSADDTSGVLLALQQMISKGTVQAEELRGQLGERLPGAFQVAAKAMGVTTAELGKMLEQGQVIADDFLPKFAAALEKNLGGAAESAANRLDASVNRFENAWARLKQTGGDSGVSKAVSNELAAITRDLDAVSDGMERARRAGGGMFAEFGTGAAVATGRAAFSTLNLAANTLNGSINALTGGVFGLRTDLALLPDIFKTDAQYAKALADRLSEAESKMAALQGTGASTSPNPYIRSSFVQLQEYIKELKAAQAEQAKLTGAKPANTNMNEGVIASGRAREAYYNQRAKDEDAANAFRLKQSGVPDGYLKDMAELIRLNQAGVIVGDEYTAALKKQQDELLKKTGAVKSSNAAATQEQNSYESLISSIRAKIEADKLELAGGAALTESQKIRIKLDQDLAAGKVKLGSAREKEIRLAIDELATAEASLLAQQTIAKANLAAATSREKYISSLASGIDKIKADTAAQLEATARLGLSKEAIAELDAAKLEMLATDLELQAIKAMDRNLDEQTYNALKQQAEAYRDLAAAKKAGATKEMALDLEKASRDAAKKAEEEWQRAADDINRALTDSLLRGFESGKGFAENLRDTIVNMFKTMVLRPIISAVISPISGAISSTISGALGGGSSGGASVLGTASNAFSLYRAGSQLYTLGGQYAAGTMSGANVLGTAWANGTGAGLDGLLATNGAYGTAGGGTAAAGSGAGGGMGAFGVYAVVAAILANAFGAFKERKQVDSGLVGTLGKGDLTNYALWRESGSLFGGPEYSMMNPAQLISDKEAQLARMRESGTAAGPEMYTLEQEIKNLKEIYAGIIASTKVQSDSIQAAYGLLRTNVGDMADVLGLSSEAVRSFTMALDTGVINGDTGQRGLQLGGLTDEQVAAKINEALATANNTLAEQVIGSWVPFTETISRTVDNIVGTGENAEHVFDTITETTSGMRYVASEYARDGEKAIDTLTRLATSLSTVNKIWDTLGYTMLDASLAGGDFASSLVDAFGGLEAMVSKFDSYYQNFYTETERRDKSREQLQTQLSDLGMGNVNFDDPNARAEYRKAVDEAIARASAQDANRRALSEALSGIDLQSVTTRVLGDVLAGLGGQGDATPEALAGLAASLTELGASATGLGDFQQAISDYIATNAEALGIEDDAAATAAALIELSGAFAAVTQASEDSTAAAERQAEAERQAAEKAQSQAFRNLQEAYAREQKVLEARLDGLEQYRAYVEKQQSLQQESLDLITGVFDVLHSSVLDLYGSVSSTAAMQAEQGRNFIEQALGTALRTGYLPDQGQLSEAIQAARAGIDSGVYANTTEQDFAKLVLAGQLRALEEVAGKQKTDAEKQLDALEKQLKSLDDQTDAIEKQLKLQQEVLDYWQEQIDIANGVYDATLSVEDAIRELAKVLGAELIDNSKAPYQLGSKAPGSGGNSGATFGGGGGSAQPPAKYSRLIYGGTAGVGYEGIRDQSLIDRLDKLSPVYHSFDGTGDLPGLAAAMKSAGGTIADLSILSGNYESDWRKAFEGVGIPAFAVGTNYVPRDMLAQIHEGEAIVPKAFNPWAGGSMGSDNTALITEIRSLRAEVAGLRAAAESTAAATGDTADVLVRVTNNGNGMVTAAAPI